MLGAKMTCCCDSSGQQVTATVTYKDDISGEVKEGQGDVVFQTKLCGGSVLRKEHYGKHYKHYVVFGGIYVNAATSGRRMTSKSNEAFLAVIRVLGCLLLLPTWRAQYQSLGYKVTVFKALLVLLLGSILVLADYITDLMTGVEHIRNGDIFWGCITLAIPLFSGFLTFISVVWSKSSEKRLQQCFRSVLHCIVWTLFYQFILARDFFKTIFEPNYTAIRKTSEHTQIGKNIFRDQYLKSVIYKQIEAFVESASQLFLQFYIIFNRGYVTYIQIISIVISIISLSLTSAESHFHCQSLAMDSGILTKIKVAPIFVIVILSRVLTFSFICSFSVLGDYDVPLIIILIIVGNVAIIVLLNRRWMQSKQSVVNHLSAKEIFLSSITSVLTTSLKVASSTIRFPLDRLLLFYHSQTTFTSLLGIAGCVILSFYHLEIPAHELPTLASYILLPLQDNFPTIIITMVLLQLAPAVLSLVLYITQVAGRGITIETCNGKLDPTIEYISEVVTGTEGSKNFSLLVPGSDTDVLAPGTSVRLSSFAIIGDECLKELTLCRYDKFMVLPWTEDGYHSKNLWMKVRVIGVWYDLNTRSMRHNISQQPIVGSEGYVPSHLSYYEVIQMVPHVKYWWEPALELIGPWVKIRTKLKNIKCCMKKERPVQLNYLVGKGGCSKIFGDPVPQMSFVCTEDACVSKACPSTLEHSCTEACLQRCSEPWLCGWCSSTCHADHSTEAIMSKLTWDNSKVDNRKQYGRVFSCACTCSSLHQEREDLLTPNETV